MADIKLTKNELRSQQLKQSQLKKYLPTLQLKKALLQVEVNQIEMKIAERIREMNAYKEVLERSSRLFCDTHVADVFSSLEITEVRKQYENIAGVECPELDEVIFAQRAYSYFDTPLWVDSATEQAKQLLIAREYVEVAREKKRALEKELRDVSIRVNLFEKILIPRTESNIKKIKVFLGDQQLASVAQAKVAKAKIEKRKARDN